MGPSARRRTSIIDRNRSTLAKYDLSLSPRHGVVRIADIVEGFQDPVYCVNVVFNLCEAVADDLGFIEKVGALQVAAFMLT